MGSFPSALKSLSAGKQQQFRPRLVLHIVIQKKGQQIQRQPFFGDWSWVAISAPQRNIDGMKSQHKRQKYRWHEEPAQKTTGGTAQYSRAATALLCGRGPGAAIQTPEPKLRPISCYQANNLYSLVNFTSSQGLLSRNRCVGSTLIGKAIIRYFLKGNDYGRGTGKGQAQCNSA